jgi:hypothetical protein
LDWLVGDIEELERHDLPIDEEGPLSKADISAENVHSNMRKVRDYQVFYKLYSLTKNYSRPIIGFGRHPAVVSPNSFIRKSIFGDFCNL